MSGDGEPGNWSPTAGRPAYTDGLVERRGEDIDASLDRLAGLRPHSDGDLGGLVDRILSLLVVEPADDDIAVLAARIVR